MQKLLIAAILLVSFAACNDNNNRDIDTNDSTRLNNRMEDTSLPRPGDSLRQDTIRMDTNNRPQGTIDSIRQRY